VNPNTAKTNNFDHRILPGISQAPKAIPKGLPFGVWQLQQGFPLTNGNLLYDSNMTVIWQYDNNE